MTIGYHQIFIYFVPHGVCEIDIRVFNNEGLSIGYIEGALVEIYQNSTLVKSGLTDSNGKYSTVLGAGTYRIVISKSGFETIEKNETLAYPTELMVNLPYATKVEQRSGMAALFVTGAVGNPIITTTGVVLANLTKKTAKITTSYTLTKA